MKNHIIIMIVISLFMFGCSARKTESDILYENRQQAWNDKIQKRIIWKKEQRKIELIDDDFDSIFFNRSLWKKRKPDIVYNKIIVFLDKYGKSYNHGLYIKYSKRKHTYKRLTLIDHVEMLKIEYAKKIDKPQ